MMSEAGGAVFIKDSKIYSTKKLSGILTLKALLYFISSHLKNMLWAIANKCLVNCHNIS